MYYEYFHSICGYVIIACVYVLKCLIVSLLDNGIIQSVLIFYDMWTQITGSPV